MSAALCNVARCSAMLHHRPRSPIKLT